MDYTIGYMEGVPRKDSCGRWLPVAHWPAKCLGNWRRTLAAL